MTCLHGHGEKSNCVLEDPDQKSPITQVCTGCIQEGYKSPAISLFWVSLLEMEHLSYEKWLKVLGIFSLEKALG